MLTLPIKKKWFDMICSGEKREEYRGITDYYGTRFRNENPDLFNQVNHKDENKSNNKAENLEWCDGMYNTHYGTAIERMRERRWGKAPTIIPAEEG